MPPTRPGHCDGSSRSEPHPARAQTAQPWGTWSTHAESWLDDSVPFPVHLVRYEDLIDDAVATLAPIFDAVGLHCTGAELRAAVGLAGFDALRRSEEERGFRGTHQKTQRFFRRGVAGGWRDDLDDHQVTTIETEHGAVMRRLGYAPASDATAPLALPAQLGIRVREGTLPDDLPGAKSPRPWMQATPTAALVRFRGRAGLLVEHGTDVTVDRGTRGADEVGWMVQGWAVTLAMLQRGLLSLHASTVEIGDAVVAIAGGRGAGKSTTAMGLRDRGHRLLCDDVTVVDLRPDGAWTTPYWRNVHLLEDSALAVGVDFDELPPLGRGRAKAAFRPEDPPDEPRRLDRIVVLAMTAASASVTATAETGASRLSALLDHTIRDGIAPLILGQERYFAQVAQLADVVPITTVSRPVGAWTLDAVLDAIEAMEAST